jgi:membrane-associated phospholipid phosphatase
MKKQFFKTVLSLTLLSFLSFYFSPTAFAENEDITEAGDYLQIILPAVAGLSTFVAGNDEGGLWDKEGTYQVIKSIGFSLATMGVGKEFFQKIRPDFSDPVSFPSGHTTAAFAGAGFIDQRYGHWWGVPALLLAGFTGYSRVQSYNHFADDVTAGASIGLMYNWLFVTPQSESSNVSVLPMVANGGAGLTLTISEAVKNESKTKPVSFKSRKSRYNFLFGPAYLHKNEIKASRDTGTKFDLAYFEKVNDPTTTAAIDIAFYLDDRNEVSIYFSPFESRDRGSFSNPVSFSGQTFPANTQIYSDWLLYDLRGRWLYNLTPASPWNVKAGVALSYQYIETSLATASGSLFAEVTGDVLLPFVSAMVSYQVNPKFSLGVEAEGIYFHEDSALNANIFLNYRISDRWDFTAGYTYFVRNIDTSDIQNDVVYHAPYLGVAYSWL